LLNFVLWWKEYIGDSRDTEGRLPLAQAMAV